MGKFKVLVSALYGRTGKRFENGSFITNTDVDDMNDLLKRKFVEPADEKPEPKKEKEVKKEAEA